MSQYGPFDRRSSNFRPGSQVAPRWTTRMPTQLSIRANRAARHCDADGHSSGDARHRSRPHRLFAGAAATRRSAPRRNICLRGYAFETLGYRRYEWKCNSHNAASWRAALRYGFIFEGMLAPAHDRQEAATATLPMFSMLDSEWPVRKANFERWLSAGQFYRRWAAESSA